MLRTGEWRSTARDILQPHLTVRGDGFHRDPPDPASIEYRLNGPVPVYEKAWRWAVFDRIQLMETPPQYEWLPVHEIHKPNLFYWLVATAGKIGLPLDASGLRLLNALPAILLVAGVFLWGRRWFDSSSGFWAAAALATGVHFMWLARESRMDMLLALMITAVFWCWEAGYRADRRQVRIACFGAFYILLAGATLLKSVGYVLVTGLAIMAYLLVEHATDSPTRGLDRLKGFPSKLIDVCRRMWIVPGILLFAMIVLPWNVLIHQATEGQYTREMFLVHSFARAGVMEADREMETDNEWWFYLVRICVDLFPWVIMVPGAVRHVFLQRNRHWRRQGLYLLCWAGVYLAFFSAMGFRRKTYIVPIYPPLMLLAGKMLADHIRDRRVDAWLDKALRRAFVGVSIAFVAASGVALTLTSKTVIDEINSRELFGANQFDQTGLLAIHRFLTENLAGAIAVLASLAAASCAIGVLGVRGRLSAACATLAICAGIGEAGICHVFMDRFLDVYRSQRPFAEHVKTVRKPGEPLVVFKSEEHELFYLLGDVHFAPAIHPPRSQGIIDLTNRNWRPAHNLASFLLGQTGSSLVVVERGWLGKLEDEKKKYPGLGKFERIEFADRTYEEHHRPLAVLRHHPST
jgi:4-amino-4-deoxy-L-arabinose transferase-like glycosyltransferase